MGSTAMQEQWLATFGEAMRAERETCGYSHKNLADRVGVQKSLIAAWERDEVVPSRFHVKKLIGSMRSLKHYAHLIGATSVPVPAGSTRAAPGTVIELHGVACSEADTRSHDVMDFEDFAEVRPRVLVAPAPPATLGEALKQARVREGLSQDELGELVGVHGTSISNWEIGAFLPIADHYAKLRDLLPELTLYRGEEYRDMEKPGRSPGSSPAAVEVAGPDRREGEGVTLPGFKPCEETKEEEMANASGVHADGWGDDGKTPMGPAGVSSAGARMAEAGVFTAEPPNVRVMMIRWGRLVCSVRERHDGEVAELLEVARDAGMTLEDVIAALSDS